VKARAGGSLIYILQYWNFALTHCRNKPVNIIRTVSTQLELPVWGAWATFF